MTEITAPKSPVTAEQFADEIREQLKYTQNVTTEQATPADVYVAASKAVRNHLADSWFKTQADTVNGNTKAVGYLSAEFLMGKQLRNALLNAGLTEQFDKAVEALGFKPKDIVDAEYEPGLGNGGLGRLAACFIDSLASLGVPAFGYGIQYKYGIFKQEFDKDGKPVETPDYWPTKSRGATSTTTATRRFPSAARSSRTPTAPRPGSPHGPCAPCRWTTWSPATSPAA